MTRALQVLLLLHGLLQVCPGQHWAVLMPGQVLGLGSSCVLLPCSFTLPSEFEPQLDGSCRAVWRRGSWSRTKVYDSGASAADNQVQGNLTGNLQNKDCSTVFYDLPSNQYDDYYFRLECETLKFNFYDGVQIRIQDVLPGPTVSPSGLEVNEGSEVTLSCTAVAPCPSEAPVLEWSPALGGVRRGAEGGLRSAVMEFSASHLHDGATVSCSALYRRAAVNAELLYETSLTLHVLYAPKNVSVLDPGPVTEGSPVTLSCGARANPAADTFSWFSVDGDQVSAVGSAQDVAFVASEAQSHFFCRVGNTLGLQDSAVFRLDVQFPPKDTSVQVDPPGAAVESSSVSLLCVTRSNPPASRYAWFKDGLEQTEVRGAVLVWEIADHSHSGTYHCEVWNQLGHGKSDPVQLDVQYPPKKTVVSSAPSGPVEEGSSVTLSCSAEANPPSVNFTWYRVSGRLRALVGHGSHFSFNVSRLSDDQFYCGAVNVHGAEFSRPVSINVTFTPEILSSSRCVKIMSQVRCSCEAQGNPGPSLLWELSGDRVNHSALTPITEEPLSSVRTRSTITLHALDRDMPPLACHAVNSLGTDSLGYNVSSSHTQLGLHTPSLLIGSAAGATAMCVLSLPLLLLLCRRQKRGRLTYKKVRESSDARDDPEVSFPKMNGALKEESEQMDPVYDSCGDGAGSQTIEEICKDAQNEEQDGNVEVILDRLSDKTNIGNGFVGQQGDEALE